MQLPNLNDARKRTTNDVLRKEYHLNDLYKNIGVGYYQDARGVKYWVQLFTY